MKYLDVLFQFYFIIHIPVAIFIDSQAIFPQWIYPSVVTDLVRWYCKEFKDSMMLDPPAWFQSFIYCEVLFQLPFFVIAVKAFHQGIQYCSWIRRPMLIYATHAGTTTLAILCNVLITDSSHPSPFGQLTITDKLKLSAIYCPFLIIPVMLMFDFYFRKLDPPREHKDK